MAETNQTGRVVGIDLGTTNSLVAYMQGDAPVVIVEELEVTAIPGLRRREEAFGQPKKTRTPPLGRRRLSRRR